ncbi:MAG: hypothetical protein KDD70_01760 [Bdellovibrionales bacterium]|nr:hypothetical protein [Bdellovibrionales bacterium]
MHDPAGMEVVSKILEGARSLFDVILIDAGKVTCSAVALMMKRASRVVLVAGSCPLGLTAVDAYTDFAQRFFDDPRKVSFLFSGPHVRPKLVKDYMDPLSSSEHPRWSLPILEHDPIGERWPGNKSTLYGLGSAKTRRTLEEIATQLGVVARGTFAETDEAGDRLAQMASPKFRTKYWAHKVGYLMESGLEKLHLRPAKPRSVKGTIQPIVPARGVELSLGSLESRSKVELPTEVTKSGATTSPPTEKRSSRVIKKSEKKIIIELPSRADAESASSESDKEGKNSWGVSPDKTPVNW